MPFKDPERMRAYQHQYYLDHRTERIARANLRQRVKAPEVRIYRKERYWKKPGFRESELGRLSKHREDNHDRLNAEGRARYWTNPEKERLKDREYYKKNPAQMRTRVIKRRALQRGATGTYTTQEWNEKKMLFANCCAYCGEERPLQLQREHRIPLDRGGSNDISNIVPSCKSCNLQKGRKTDREFLGLK